MSLSINHINNTKLLAVALKRLRKNAKLTQKELAQKAGIRQATVSDLENGKGNIETLMKIIQALGVNLQMSSGETKKDSSPKMIQLLEELE